MKNPTFNETDDDLQKRCYHPFDGSGTWRFA
jgi:hypothetical protein